MERKAKKVESQMELLHNDYQLTIQQHIETIRNLESQLQTRESENFALIGENLRLKVNFDLMAAELNDRKLTSHVLIGRAFKARLENESLKRELSRMRLKLRERSKN